jgi:hypothetical protein
MSTNYKWQWKNKKWEDYSKKDSKTIESNYLKSSTNDINIKIKKNNYIISFTKNIQTNTVTSKTRDTRRIAISTTTKPIISTKNPPILSTTTTTTTTTTTPEKIKKDPIIKISPNINFDILKEEKKPNSQQNEKIKKISKLMKIRKINYEEEMLKLKKKEEKEKIEKEEKKDEKIEKKEEKKDKKDKKEKKNEEIILEKTEICSVCQMEFADDPQNILLIPCNHFFHEDCLAMCFDENGNFVKCPVCGRLYGIRFTFFFFNYFYLII